MADGFREKYLTALEIACHDQDIDPHIVDTIFYIESSWNPWAVRYEKNWKYFHKAEEFARFLRLSLESEIECQKISWGLGQLMGGSARNMGFMGHLTQLTDPETNIDIVCRMIKKIQGNYPRISDQAAVYNSGRARRMPDGSYYNQGYVDKFLRKYGQLNDFWQKNTGAKT